MSISLSKRYNSSDVTTSTILNSNDDDAQQFQQIIKYRKGMSFFVFFLLNLFFLNISMPTFLVYN
jgi:hypothetical protein